MIELVELEDGDWDRSRTLHRVLSELPRYYDGTEPSYGNTPKPKKNSLLKKLIDITIKNEEDPQNEERIELSKQEVAQFISEYNEAFGVDYADSYLIPDVEDELYMRLLREKLLPV